MRDTGSMDFAYAVLAVVLGIPALSCGWAILGFMAGDFVMFNIAYRVGLTFVLFVLLTPMALVLHRVIRRNLGFEDTGSISVDRGK